jgi:diguanylate cyclase (GGDEF)-like protein
MCASNFSDIQVKYQIHVKCAISLLFCHSQPCIIIAVNLPSGLLYGEEVLDMDALLSAWGALLFEYAGMVALCLLSFHSTRSILDVRMPSPLYRIAVSAAGAACAVLAVHWTPLYISESIVFLLLFLAYIHLWRDESSSILFLCNTYTVNILAVYSVFYCSVRTIGSDSLLLNQTVSSDAVLAGVCCIVLILFLALIGITVNPALVRAVAQSRHQRRALNIWTGICNIYFFLQNAWLNALHDTQRLVLVNQIVVCLLLLAANWAFLIFNMRIISLTSKERILRQRADHDPLTGLYNRRTAQELIERELSSGGAFFIVDVDHFKSVNDQGGHYDGDRVLKQIADSLRRSCRKGDIFGRFGGDEFVLYMTDISTEETAAKKAQQLIRQCVASMTLPSGQCRTVTVSIGCLLISPGTCGSYDAAFQMADKALYQAKARGRCTYAVYQESAAAGPERQVEAAAEVTA